MTDKIKLSEIIKTDCYIDCGTNDRLREVLKLITIPIEFRVFESDRVLALMTDFAYTLSDIPNKQESVYHIENIEIITPMHGKVTLKNNGEAEYICTMLSLIKAAKQMTPLLYDSKAITGQLKQELNRAFDQFDFAIRNMIAKVPEQARNLWITHYTEDQQDLAELYEMITPIPAEGKRLIVEAVKSLISGKAVIEKINVQE